MTHPAMADESPYQREKRLFGAVCDLAGEDAQRQALQALGAGDADVAAVLALLHAELHTRIGPSVDGALASVSASELAIGDVLGPWRLTAELGAGGMGSVFAAERHDGQYRQRVAIKLLRGWSSPDRLERMARERQILASLSHPHIARLLDGGTTPRGDPYLVMDHVDGVPIDAWCRAAPRRVAQLLALADMVGAALAAAHQQRVVHCDLKPSNVLVTPQERALLLDFGIAQLLGQDDGGDPALTPHYASPEQRAGGRASLASDIYGLGRLLGELLPLCSDAGARRGEWQAIVDKACAERPDARYPTVQALQSDIERFRRHLPLRAMPARTPYRVGKLLRRRWSWSLAGVLAAAAGVAFTLRLVHERDRALAAEQRSRQEIATTASVSAFVVGLFKDADPRRAGQPDLPAHLLLERGRDRMAQELQDKPQQQAALGRVLAEAFENLGRFQDAEALYEQAAEREAAPPLNKPLRAAEALSRLAVLRSNAFRAAQAEAPARRQLALRLQSPQATVADLADGHNTLGLVLTQLSRLDEAAPLLQRALTLRREQGDPNSLETAATLHNLALLHQRAERFDEAERVYREALALKRQHLPAAQLTVLNTQENLAVVLGILGRPAEAQALWQELLQARVELHGRRSRQVVNALNGLGSALQDAGALAAARQRYLEAMEADPDAANSMPRALTLNNLATVEEDLGLLQAAELHHRQSLALRVALVGANDLAVARARHNLGRLLLRMGRLDEARELLQAGLALRLQRQGDSHSDTTASRLVLVELHLARHDLAGAQAVLQQAQAAPTVLPAARRAALARAQAQVAAAQGDHQAALAHAQQALAQADQAYAAGHPARVTIALELAQAQADTGLRTPALQQLAALSAVLSLHGPAAPTSLLAQALAQRLARS